MINCLSGFIDLLSQAHAFIRRHSFSPVAALAIGVGKGCIGRVVPVVGFPCVLPSQRAHIGFIFPGMQGRFFVVWRTALCAAVRIASGTGKQGIYPENQENRAEEKREKNFHVFCNR